MRSHSHKLIRNQGDFDKSSAFIEIKTTGEKHPQEISIEDLLNLVPFPDFEKHEIVKLEKYNIEKDIDKHTIVLDPCTLKIKVNEDFFVIPSIVAPSVFGEVYTNQNRLYNLPPKDASKLSGIHMVANENHLYIWVGNRWKRTPLSEW